MQSLNDTTLSPQAVGERNRQQRLSSPLPQVGEGAPTGAGEGARTTIAVARQRGVTLLEALLATAIAALMMGALIQLLSESQTELRAKNVAEQIQNFQRVAANYFQSNRSQVMQAMENDNSREAGQYCRVNVKMDGTGGQAAFDTKNHTCMIDASFLQARRMLPERGTHRTVHGEKLVAIFKRRYDEDNALLTQDVEMLVLTVLEDNAQYTKNQARFMESSSIASYMGANGGVLPDRDRGKCKADKAKGVYEICGNGWKLQLEDFVGSNQLGAFKALL